MSSYPTEVQNLLDKFEDTEKSYNDCQILQNQLEGIGWTCDWGLDAEPYGVREINIQQNI